MRVLVALLGAIGAQAVCNLCPLPTLDVASFAPCLKAEIGEDCCIVGRPMVNNPCVKVWLTNPLLAPFKSVIEKARVACKVTQMASCEANVARTCPAECGISSNAAVASSTVGASLAGASPASTPACNATEEYTSCGSSSCWEQRCVDGKVVIPGPMCTADCRQGCKCAKGYVRNSTTCIPVAQCKPPANQACAANEEYQTCGSSSCWETKCVDGKIVTPGPICTADCRQGCRCRDGFARNALGSCIAQAQCKAPGAKGKLGKAKNAKNGKKAKANV